MRIEGVFNISCETLEDLAAAVKALQYLPSSVTVNVYGPADQMGVSTSEDVVRLPTIPPLSESDEQYEQLSGRLTCDNLHSLLDHPYTLIHFQNGSHELWVRVLSNNVLCAVRHYKQPLYSVSYPTRDRFFHAVVEANKKWPKRPAYSICPVKGARYDHGYGPISLVTAYQLEKAIFGEAEPV